VIRATIIAIFIALPVKTYADFLNILPKRTILQEYFQDGEYDLAFNLAENLSAESDPWSQLVLSLMYEGGFGTSKNQTKAGYWAAIAAQTGEPVALFRMAMVYEKGLGTEIDKSKALKWMKRAAKAGHEEAIIAVLEHSVQEQNTSEVFNYIEVINSEFPVDSSYFQIGHAYVASFYLDGWPMGQNLLNAVKHFQIANRATIKNIELTKYIEQSLSILCSNRDLNSQCDSQNKSYITEKNPHRYEKYDTNRFGFVAFADGYTGSSINGILSIKKIKRKSLEDRFILSIFRELLRGPTNDESEAGLFGPNFSCSSIQLQGPSVPTACVAEEIFRDVYIINDRIYLSVGAIPSAATSGEWSLFMEFLNHTLYFLGISQQEIRFWMDGYELTAGDSGCRDHSGGYVSGVCFFFLPSQQFDPVWADSVSSGYEFLER